MEEHIQVRFAQILARAAEDEIYQQLRQQCDLLDRPLLAVLEELPEEARRLVTDYIRVLGASALRLAEIACTETEKGL